MEDSLEEIREEYLANAYEEFDRLEEVLLNIENGGNVEGDMAEIFRIVHSLKGGSVSFDFPAMTKVLHVFEDYISSFKEGADLSEFYDKSISYVDDIRDYCKTYQMDPNVKIDLPETVIEKDVLFLSQSTALFEVAKPVLEQVQLHPDFCNDFDAAIKLYQGKQYKLIVISDDFKNDDKELLISHLRKTSSPNLETRVIQIESIYNKENHSVSQLTIRLTKDKDFPKNFRHAIKATKQKKKKEKIKKLESVLYIEDDLMLQKIFSAMMKKQNGIVTKIVSSMAESKEILETFKPDLILLDNVLKEERGEDVLMMLQENPALKSIPVYLLTASPEQANLEELQKKGNLKAILGKPFKFDRLLESYQSTN